MSAASTGTRGQSPEAARSASGALDLVLRAERVHTPGGFAPREVGIVGGRIVRIAPLGEGLRADREIDLAADEVLIPGLVDSHVHINEPGRTEWEGFDTATRAAARGGVTTLVDMPLNSIPPTTTMTGLAAKLAAMEGHLHVDVALWGGAVPGNRDELAALDAAGVLGFKCFTLPSGVEEFGHLEPAALEEHLGEIARLGSTMIVHAEDPQEIGEPLAPRTAYRSFLESRPPEAEVNAIAQVIEAARRTGARIHLLHVSAASALPLIAEAKAEGLPLTAETCPHYLCLDAAGIGPGATDFKCCPPIRDADNREALWGGLLDGTLDLVVTDHSPSTPELKAGDFAEAWGGVSSLQLGLATVWSEARRRGIGLERVIGWMSQAPAALAGLPGKGAIAVGHDADLAIFAPEDSFTVDPELLEHRHPITPYAGQRLHGRVRRTILGGRDIALGVHTGRHITRGQP